MKNEQASATIVPLKLNATTNPKVKRERPNKTHLLLSKSKRDRLLL